jgi:CRISPR/Cas system-associated protein Cas7 (RAMP superfamily)
LHVWVGHTRQEHAGKGIATQLRAFMCDHARKTKRFEYLFVQATNPATRKIHVNKMRGKIMIEIDPTEWLSTKKEMERHVRTQNSKVD